MALDRHRRGADDLAPRAFGRRELGSPRRSHQGRQHIVHRDAAESDRRQEVLRPTVAVIRRDLLEAALLAALLCGPLYLYSEHFYRNPTYDLARASRFMETLPPGSVVMGQEAPRLTLGTPLRSLLAYEGWFNDRDPFTRFGPTHVIVLDRFGGAELGWIRRRFPETAARLEVARRFTVWDTTMTLYRVPSGVPPPSF